jgi:hypothetical protein
VAFCAPSAGVRDERRASGGVVVERGRTEYIDNLQLEGRVRLLEHDCDALRARRHRVAVELENHSEYVRGGRRSGVERDWM